HTARNGLRALLLSFAGGRLEHVPFDGAIERHYRQLARFCAAFALLTDATLLAIGGGLKARQRLSGRMADALVQLYYATAVIKFWHDAAYPEEQRPLVEWSLQKNLFELQQALRDAIDNFPVAGLRRPLRWLVFPPGHTSLAAPGDDLGRSVALSIVDDTALRDLLAAGAYRNESPDDPLGRVLNAYRLARETQSLRDRLHAAVRERDEDDLDGIALLMGHQRAELVDWAVSEGVVGEGERDALLEALSALYDVLRVDAFEADGLRELAEACRGKRRVVERQRAPDTPEAPGAQLAAVRLNRGAAGGADEIQAVDAGAATQGEGDATEEGDGHARGEQEPAA
ncbi:MAG: acyl-CoA dehydrogenase domain-containing protein, partial [Halieaceae bacterium]|nr:acyl-CoA dehydrogenase domain-containing protein [Halieaceae bacterium]